MKYIMGVMARRHTTRFKKERVLRILKAGMREYEQGKTKPFASLRKLRSRGSKLEKHS